MRHAIFTGNDFLPVHGVAVIWSRMSGTPFLGFLPNPFPGTNLKRSSCRLPQCLSEFVSSGSPLLRGLRLSIRNVFAFPLPRQSSTAFRLGSELIPRCITKAQQLAISCPKLNTFLRQLDKSPVRQHPSHSRWIMLANPQPHPSALHSLRARNPCKPPPAQP
jgi:hypothetical protein